MTTLLTEKEYKNTFGARMIDVTKTAEPIIDIWPYVQRLTEEGLVLNYVNNKQLVDFVYRTEDNLFDHVLLPTDNSNIFIVIIVDNLNRKIKGHFPLDLNEQYGLT